MRSDLIDTIIHLRYQLVKQNKNFKNGDREKVDESYYLLDKLEKNIKFFE